MNEKEMADLIKTCKWIGGIFIALILFFNTIGTIGAGHRGVVYTFGAITGIKSEGLYVKIPFVQGVTSVDIKTQVDTCVAQAASKDLQTIKTEVAINYNLKANHVGTLYKEIGSDFKARVVDPSIQESVKAITAKFTAEELITKREVAREEIQVLITSKLVGYGIVVTALNITDFDFSKTFNDAIEAKVTAVQKALEAEKKLVQVKFEAEQKIAEAQGKAKALQIEGTAISNNPKIVALRAIEKWNGELPQIVGANGVMPMIGDMSPKAKTE